MKVVIIEDEYSAVQNLQHLFRTNFPELEVRTVLDTVRESVQYFRQGPQLDLIFLDIHLADGNSFELLEEVEIQVPIIFTTAYEEYAVQAFKVNSIDYLLKPIREEDLRRAIEKFQKQKEQVLLTVRQIQQLLQLNQAPRQLSSLLAQKGEALIPVPVDQIAFIYIENGVVRLTTLDASTYHLDQKLEELEQELSSANFFRANRQYLINRSAIQRILPYFHGRLLVQITPAAREKVIVSKAKAATFKDWLRNSV